MRKVIQVRNYSPESYLKLASGVILTMIFPKLYTKFEKFCRINFTFFKFRCIPFRNTIRGIYSLLLLEHYSAIKT